ncbi:MAG: polyphosphate polymerase domain-containing protein [Planctomycetota bacterium]
MAAKTKLHFSRFEFKYLLPAKLRAEVESELSHFVEFDPFVEGRPDHRYLVRSLYWDDRRLSAFRDKIDGVMVRSKFRIRTYTTDPDEPVPRFLEIKGRNNNLVVKHRTPVDIGTESSQVAGDSLAELVMANAVEGPIQQEFSFQRYRRRIQPYCLIDYQRRPFVSRFDPEFRLTFDEELTATRTDRLFPKRTDRTVRVAPGYTVMEVKFRHHLPSWFHRIIQGYELRRLSFSKICEGTVALGLADED